MKTEELVAALRKDCRDCGSNSLCLNGEMNVYCAVRDAADRLEGYVDRCVRFSEEIMVLRERGRNDPLSLDELRQMDGEPVWAKHCHGGEWVVVHWNIYGRITTAYNAELRYDEYGETWLAYRQKPEEETV